MTIKSMFFNAVKNGNTYDRVYSAEDFSGYLDKIVGDGVFASPSVNLQVIANNPANMAVYVHAGQGWIKGHKFISTEPIGIIVPAAHGTSARVDSVNFYLDYEEREMGVRIVTGTPGSSEPPALRQTSTFWEYRLARLDVGAGATYISQANITDRRGTPECPFVAGLIEEIDAESLFAQWDDQFNDWLVGVQEQLSEMGSFVSGIRRLEAVYTTSAASTVSSFNVTTYIPEYSSVTDCLELFINGLKLTTEEYTLSGNTVTLSEAIVQKRVPIDIVVWHVDAGGNNYIETVKLDGNPLTPDENRAVNIPVDDTLTQTGIPADSKKVGDEMALTNEHISDLNDDVERIISGDTKYLPADIAALTKFSALLLYKVKNVTDGETGIADVPAIGGNAYAFKIPLDNVTRLTYPVFKSSDGNGSFICNDSDVVIWHYYEAATSGMSLKTIDVPHNAKYLILSTPLSFFDGTYSNWYVELISNSLVSLGQAVSQLNEDVPVLEDQMALYTDRIIGGKELSGSLTWVEGYAISENGSISANANFHYSDLIPVIDGTYKLVIKGIGSNNNTRIHAYDENGNWIKQIIVVGTGTSTDPITIPIVCDGFANIRISTAKAITIISLLSPVFIGNDPYNPLGLHTIPENNGVLNAIKRARQMTDIEWTPGADLERAFMDTGDSYLTSHGQTYKGTFLAGTKYKGLPYSERNVPYRWLGIEVPLEAFCSAIEKNNSVIALESTYTQYGANYYGCVCTSLTCYALDLPYTISMRYDSIPGMAKITDVNNNFNASVIKLGDILQISGHCAIITDIYTDKTGNVTFIEISEETRQGNSNRSHKTGEFGSVCRRCTMTVKEFISWFNGFSVYRYAYIDKVSYYSCPYVPMPDEGNRICIHDYPLMPYMGNKTTYGTGSAPTVKLIFDTPDYSTLLVYKNGVQFGQYDITNQSYYNVVCDTDEAKYTACLAVIGASNSISYSSQSVEWYCRPHDTPVVSVSGGVATISVSNIGGFKPYCVIIGTTFINGGYTRLFDGDYTSSTSGGLTTYSFQIPFDYDEEKSCKLFIRSDEWGVCEYNFTITP